MKKKTRALLFIHVALLVLSAAIISTAVPSVWAATDPTLIGGTAVTGYSGTPTPITDLQLSGTGNPTTPVKLRVTSGSLSMSTTTGLTFTGSSSGSTLQFSGTLSNINAALATLQYTRGSTGTDTLEASLVSPGEVFFPDNGHLYEYVSSTTTWNQAKTAAEGRTKYAATGYLTTITSQSENDFVAARLVNAGWMGASDASAEGTWRWVTGPENNTQFWSGNFNGSAFGGNYANWNTGEPNDSGSNEDCGQFLSGSSGKWNDLPCSVTTLPGYVVEYGSNSSPIEVSSKNVSITTQAPNQYPNLPASLGPTNLANNSWSTNTAPTFTYSLLDSDSGDTVGYRIQVDDSADFSSPIIDYTSGTKSQGSFNFVVGQTAGAGTSGVGSYSVGSVGQTLANGSYYWRVRAFDNVGANSSYATANGGAVAFKIDTTAPTTPGQPATASPTTNTEPTFTWTASTDTGSGLAPSAAYTIEWSQYSDFSSVHTATATTASYTITSGQALADGVWYFRVKATDALNTVSAYSSTSTVIVDTTAPTIPTTLLVTSPATVNTPTVSWSASADATVGLDTPAYTLEWSPYADFSSAVTTDTTSLTSYTLTTVLADGTWYFRVKASDTLHNESSFSTAASIAIDTAPKAATPSPQAPAAQQNVESQFLSSSNTNTAASDDTPQTADPTPTQIILNSFTEYTDGDGKELSLQVGQVIYFYLHNEQHSVTIKEIHDDYIVATIASTPRDVRINRDGTVEYDVDQDGTRDIVISLKAVTSGTASILFKLPSSPSADAVHEAPNNKDNGEINWLIIALIILAVTTCLYAIWRRKKREHPTI